jgi:2-isopropylmalate synthase
LKDRRTYEIMRPEDIGLPPSDLRMHVGKLSGRAALDAQLRELGYTLTPEELAHAFPLVKQVLGKKKVLEEMDLRRCAELAMATPVSAESVDGEGDEADG